jgi:hypothetical protein
MLITWNGVLRSTVANETLGSAWAAIPGECPALESPLRIEAGVGSMCRFHRDEFDTRRLTWKAPRCGELCAGLGGKLWRCPSSPARCS